MTMCKFFSILIIIEYINCFSISNFFAPKRKKLQLQQPVKSFDSISNDEISFNPEIFPGKIIATDIEISPDAGIISSIFTLFTIFSLFFEKVIMNGLNGMNVVLRVEQDFVSEQEIVYQKVKCIAMVRMWKRVFVALIVLTKTRKI